MPNYAYRAVDERGVVNRGEALAANENELFAKLHQQGLSLVDCRSNDAARHFWQKKIGLEEQILLCRHLMLLCRAGVPVHVALEDILPALPKKLRLTMRGVLQNVMGGQSLSSAFSASGAGFDPLFQLLLQAGEKSGRLADAMQFLHESLLWKKDYAQQTRRALAYPLVQFLLASAAVVVMLTVAVPQIIQLLGMIGETLPWYSDVLLIFVKLLGAGFMLFVAMVFVTLLGAPVLKKLHGDVAVMVDRGLLSLPVLGPLFSKIELAQMTHIFSALLCSGMGVMECLSLLPGLTQNRALAASLSAVHEEVGSGQNLSQALTKQGLIPAYTLRILKIGEDSGKMAESLRHLSTVYQEESRTALDGLLKISSLFITFVVGLILILMVVGVMVPLYRGISHMGAA